MDVLGFYRGVQSIHHDTERLRREIRRYARVSFVLDIQQQNDVDFLSLHRSPEFSRCGEPLPVYILGLLESDGASRKRLKSVGKTLCRVLSELETPPVVGREQWENESFNGGGVLLPVAIHKTDYFLKHGLSAPETYMTNDPASREFLSQLRG